jgi:translocator protein
VQVRWQRASYSLLIRTRLGKRASSGFIQRIAVMQSYDQSKLFRDAGYAVVAIVVVAGTSVIGQLATYPNLAPWYAGLVKPAFNPPNWIFAPVWTFLYALMVFAVWRILRLPQSSVAQFSAARRLALSLFFTQLTLNAAWSWMFFGANNPLLGLVNIVPQFLVIVATVVAFYRLDRMAAWCLLPLVAWVAFASVLNVAIWQLNG